MLTLLEQPPDFRVTCDQIEFIGAGVAGSLEDFLASDKGCAEAHTIVDEAPEGFQGVSASYFMDDPNYYTLISSGDIVADFCQFAAQPDRVEFTFDSDDIDGELHIDVASDEDIAALKGLNLVSYTYGTSVIDMIARTLGYK